MLPEELNAKKQKTIVHIDKALGVVNAKIPDFSPGSKERNKMESASSILEGLHWKMVHNDIQTISGELSGFATILKDISADLKTINDKLNEMGEEIENASRVLSSLIDAVAMIPHK